MLGNLHYKSVLLIGFFIFISGCQICFGQEKPNYVTFDEVLNKLTFSSKVDKLISEINQKLIEQILERKVDFILTEENEIKLKKAGANKLLFEAINKHILEDVKKKRLLEQERTVAYEKFFIISEGESIKSKIEAAREFLEKYSDDPEVKEVIEYLKEYLARNEKPNCNY